MTIYYILKPFDYPAESIVTTPFFPLEEPHSAPRRLDFGRFHGRAAETDLRSNPPHPQKGRFLWTNASSEPQRP